MAFTMPQFGNATDQQLNPLADLVKNAMSAYQGGVQTRYAAPNAQQDLQQKQLSNLIRQVQAQYAKPMAEQNLQKSILENKFYAPNIKSEINLRRSQGTNLDTESDLKMLKLNYPGLGEPGIVGELAYSSFLSDNPQIAERLKNAGSGKQSSPLDLLYGNINADINQKNALANLRKLGGPGMGVGGKEELFFQHLVSQDNPQLNNDPDKIYEASNVLRNGGTQLSDGTQLNPLSPASEASWNRISKGETTSPLITQGIRANQAEKEVEVLNDYAQKGLEPYGDTFMNMSPQQIVDSFKGDDVSQKKLGRLVASQALQYEIAQNRIKLANGQPGVTSTEELMKLSGQTIKTKFPEMSYKARKEASDYLDKALSAGLEARQKVNLGASSLKPNVTKKVSEQLNNNKVTKRWTRDANGKLVQEGA